MAVMKVVLLIFGLVCSIRSEKLHFQNLSWIDVPSLESQLTWADLLSFNDENLANILSPTAKASIIHASQVPMSEVGLENDEAAANSGRIGTKDVNLVTLISDGLNLTGNCALSYITVEGGVDAVTNTMVEFPLGNTMAAHDEQDCLQLNPGITELSIYPEYNHLQSELMLPVLFDSVLPPNVTTFFNSTSTGTFPNGEVSSYVEDKEKTDETINGSVEPLEKVLQTVKTYKPYNQIRNNLPADLDRILKTIQDKQNERMKKAVIQDVMRARLYKEIAEKLREFRFVANASLQKLHYIRSVPQKMLATLQSTKETIIGSVMVSPSWWKNWTKGILPYIITLSSVENVVMQLSTKIFKGDIIRVDVFWVVIFTCNLWLLRKLGITPKYLVDRTLDVLMLVAIIGVAFITSVYFYENKNKYLHLE